jgi:hypothetical protein
MVTKKNFSPHSIFSSVDQISADSIHQSMLLTAGAQKVVVLVPSLHQTLSCHLERWQIFS